MVRDDVLDLMAIVAAGDHRTVAEPDVVLWQHMLGHLSKDDCADAIMWHRAERPGVWLEPGHVLQRVRAMRADRLARMSPDERDALSQSDAPRDQWGYVDKSSEEYTPTIAVSAAPPASEATRRAFFDEWARMREIPGEDGVREEVPSVNTISVRCPFCRSAPGDWCSAPGQAGGKFTHPGSKVPVKQGSITRERLKQTAAHPSRVALAALEAGFGVESDRRLIMRGELDDEGLSAGIKQIVASMTRQHVRKAREAWTPGDEAAKVVPEFDAEMVKQAKARAEAGA